MTSTSLPFETIRPLGEGATGRVELCRLTQPLGGLPAGAEVAVKTLYAEHADDAEAREAFEAEVAAGSRLDDPSLVRVVAHGVHDGHPYLVMQYVPGRSLREILTDDGPLPEPLIRGLGRQLGGALAALHAAGLVHGDVKPENVRMDDEGRAVLLDLGFARDATADAASGAGSLAYLSPERARGAGPSQAADVFALGVVLYELATGIHPFGVSAHPEQAEMHAAIASLGSSSGALLRRSIEVPGADELLAAIVDARLVLPSHFAPQLSPFFDRLLAELMERTPDRRPPAGEARERFEAGEAGGWWRRFLDSASRSRNEQPSQREAYHLTPLVGRDRELATLRRSLAAIRKPTRDEVPARVVWLSGPEGSGKWRLVNDFAARARESIDAPLYLYARWTETAEAHPAGSLSILLHRWLQLPPGTRPGAREEALLRKLVSPRTARTLLLSLDRDADVASDASVPAALAEWLAALGRSGPTLVFLDDLHRSGSETLSALGVVLDALEDTSILLVLGVRGDEPPRKPRLFEALRTQVAALRTEEEEGRGAIRIDLELGPISEADTLELVRQLFDSTAPHLRLAHILWRQSRGNPGLMSEILRDLLRRGQAHPRSEDDPALVLAIDPDDLPLPRSLERIVTDRIRALDDEDRRWLERLAVVGGRIEPAFLVHAFPPTARAEIDRVLAELVRQGWLAPAAARYRFARPALRESIYLSLSTNRRRRLHTAAARGLEGRTSAEERFQHAFHLRQAGAHEELLRVVRQLIADQRRRASAQRLLTLARWGLEAYEKLESADSRQQIELLEVAADAADRLGRREEGRAFLDHLADLDLDPEKHPGEAARLYTLHGRYAAGTGQFGLARGLLRNALQLAAASEDAHLISEAARRLGQVQAQIGEIDEARRLAERALASATHPNQAALALLARVLTDILEDNVEAALAGIDEAIETLRSADEVRLGVAADAHMLRGRVWRSAGRPIRAMRAASRAVRLAQRSGERGLEAEARARLGGLLLDLDRPEEAEAQVRDALRVADKIEDRRGAVLAGFHLAVLLWENDDAQAVASIERVTQLAHDIGFFRAEAVCLAMRARAHVERGNLDGARRDSATSIELLERHGAELADRITITGTRAYVLDAAGKSSEARTIVRGLRRLMRKKNASVKDPELRRKQRAYSTRLLETVLSPEGPVYPRTVMRDRDAR